MYLCMRVLELLASAASVRERIINFDVNTIYCSKWMKKSNFPIQKLMAIKASNGWMWKPIENLRRDRERARVQKIASKRFLCWLVLSKYNLILLLLVFPTLIKSLCHRTHKSQSVRLMKLKTINCILYLCSMQTSRFISSLW